MHGMSDFQVADIDRDQFGQIARQAGHADRAQHGFEETAAALDANRLADAERNLRELNDARLRVAELGRALATAQQRIAVLEQQPGRNGP